MPRKYRRRRKKSILKPKKGTIFSIVALILFSGSILTFLSFFQRGTVLDQLNFTAEEYFGPMKFLLPLAILLFSLLLARLKIFSVRPNIPIGFFLVFICLIALSQSGYAGSISWAIIADSVSPVGAFLILSVMLLIGLIVLFNTSIEEIVKIADSFYTAASKMLQPVLDKKKPVFVEKLPIKIPAVGEIKEQERNEEKRETTGKKKTDSVSADSFGSSILTNLPASDQVWEYPPYSILSGSAGQKADRGDMKQNAATIERTLESFGISAKVTEVNLGPAVTQYSLDIALGTKLSKITALSNDLALALAAPTGQIRIEAPIPGKRLVGIEIPNRSLEFVTLRHMLSQDILKRSKDKLLVALGLDVSGNPVMANIAKMPHVLIAGTTGSGKSVLINSWIASILFRTSPSEVRLILVDPKRVELNLYRDIPHLMAPVIVEPDKILSSLKWAIGEMERRYKLFAEVGVRHIDGYNELSGFQAIPYILIFIDELADLMAFAPVEVEDSICRLAQMARATGIHLVVATQRPSVDVITGLIKANIPSRIAFNVSSMVDSRVIIDMPGAEKLLGRGDMLYVPPDQSKPSRIQGTFVADSDVTKVVEFLKSKNTPVHYTEEVTMQSITGWKKGGVAPVNPDGHDPLFEDALRLICQFDKASASLLQRRLSVGYARAARILDQLEMAGIIGPGEGSKPRDVLIKNPEDFL